MQKLMCEVCRSTEFTKDDEDFFVCDFCRTKYSPAQAQKLIVEGTVRVDRSQEFENLLVLASSALESGNFQEALSYANRVLEIDPKNSAAWYLKGTAAGCSSSLHQDRFSELHYAYVQSLAALENDQQAEAQVRYARVINDIADSYSTLFYGQVVQSFANEKDLADCVACTQSLLGLYRYSYELDPSRRPLDGVVASTQRLLGGVPYQFYLGNKVVSSKRKVKPQDSPFLINELSWANSEIRVLYPELGKTQQKKGDVTTDKRLVAFIVIAVLWITVMALSTAIPSVLLLVTTLVFATLAAIFAISLLYGARPKYRKVIQKLTPARKNSQT